MDKKNKEMNKIEINKKCPNCSESLIASYDNDGIIWGVHCKNCGEHIDLDDVFPEVEESLKALIKVWNDEYDGWWSEMQLKGNKKSSEKDE